MLIWLLLTLAFGSGVPLAEASGFGPDDSCPYRLPAAAGVRGKIRVDVLYAQADLVVIGRVTEARIVDPARERGVMRVRITETLKGAASGPVITVGFHKPNCDNTACGGDGIPGGLQTEFLFSLRRAPDGSYARLICRGSLATGYVENGRVHIGVHAVDRAALKRYLESKPAPVDEP
ncbi:MAG TPA: hypothetical protein VFN71_07485 [Methylomirabilota bacterium]|nr:hypothetical protein [Methylomirabilota bacterium]